VTVVSSSTSRLSMARGRGWLCWSAAQRTPQPELADALSGSLSASRKTRMHVCVIRASMPSVHWLGRELRCRALAPRAASALWSGTLRRFRKDKWTPCRLHLTSACRPPPPSAEADLQSHVDRGLSIIRAPYRPVLLLRDGRSAQLSVSEQRPYVLRRRQSPPPARRQDRTLDATGCGGCLSSSAIALAVGLHGTLPHVPTEDQRPASVLASPYGMIG
jgi:hypothetical protein